MYIFCSYKQPKEKRQNHAEIGQNLNNLLNNLQAKGKFHIAGFSIVIIKDVLYYKRRRTLNSLGTIKVVK